jgi:hypothetical protein
MIGVPLSRAISTFTGFIKSLIGGKSLTERTAEVATDPQESASAGTDNIDTMIARNPEQLAELLMDSKFQTDNWAPKQYADLAIALARNGDTGTYWLAQLIDEKKLQTNDWEPKQYADLAIALARNGDTGMGLLNIDTDMGLLNGDTGIGLLEQLIKDGKLENFEPQELSSEDANKFAIALVLAGKEGATLLATLIEKGQLKTNDWGPVQRYKLAIALVLAGKEGATPLATLIEKGQLKTDGWDDNQCSRLVFALASAEKEGAKVLGLLIEKGQLKTDGWNALQCNTLVGALAKAGKEGAKWLGLLIKDDKLKNLTLNQDQCNELAAALVEKDPILLARLLRDNLQGLTLDEMQCNALAMKLIVAGSTGPHCLRALLMKDKLQQFKLLGCNDCPASKKKALDLLSKNPPGLDELAELKSLIDIGLKNRLIYVAKSNITKLKKYINRADLKSLISAAKSNITELKKYINRAESKNSIMDKLNGLIGTAKSNSSIIDKLKNLMGKIQSRISNHSDPEPDEGIELDDDIITGYEGLSDPGHDGEPDWTELDENLSEML